MPEHNRSLDSDVDVVEAPARRFIPRVAHPLTEFLSTEAAGGAVLLVAAVVALGWANSAWSDAYARLWETNLTLGIGSFVVEHDLRAWVNEGLMTIFFLVVGLEIKRELIVGELRDPRRALLPVVAAAGGMVLPALIYVALNAGDSDAVRGWGVPMATDIAFAVGVLTLVGRRLPIGLKVFLLAVAIVDDVGAILVIALVYSHGVSAALLLAAAGACAVFAALIRARLPGSRRAWITMFLVFGVGVWALLLESGVHATLAGVVLGLVAPVHARASSGEDDAPEAMVSIAERLENLLHPWSSFLVLPVFALANAGVDLRESTFAAIVGSQVAVGIAAGLIIGKTVGVGAATYLVSKIGWGRLPPGTNWRHIVGLSLLCGIGFTVALFVAGLAFDERALVDEAKIGIFVASVASGLLGMVVLRGAPRSHGT